MVTPRGREAPDVIRHITDRLAAQDRPTYQQLAEDCDSRFGTDFCTGESIRKFAKRRKLRPRVDLAGAVQQERNVLVERAERRELSRLLTDRARVDIIADALMAGIAQLPPLPPVNYTPPPKGSYADEHARLMLSDAHTGYWLTEAAVSGLWRYDYNIFWGYVQLLAAKIKSIMPRHNYRIPVLHIDFLGDIVENVILRAGQVWQVEFAVREQCLRAADAFVWFIREMLTIFERVECKGLPGNHGRVTQKKGDLPPSESFDLIAYDFIRFRLADEPRFAFEVIPAERHVEECFGWRILMSHGDRIKSWAGVPHYGIDRHNTNLAGLFDDLAEGIDVIELGHFHQAMIVPFRTWGTAFINGSFTGATEFSINQLGRASQPAQWLYGINAERPVTWSYKLTLAEPRARAG
jgi:hypothetical protein